MSDYERILEGALQLSNMEKWNLIDELIQSKFDKPDKDFSFISKKSSNAFHEEKLKTPEISGIFLDENNSVEENK